MLSGMVDIYGENVSETLHMLDIVDLRDIMDIQWHSIMIISAILHLPSLLSLSTGPCMILSHDDASMVFLFNCKPVPLSASIVARLNG